jgi:hypothetical protein
MAATSSVWLRVKDRTGLKARLPLHANAFADEMKRQRGLKRWRKQDLPPLFHVFFYQGFKKVSVIGFAGWGASAAIGKGCPPSIRQIALSL